MKSVVLFNAARVVIGCPGLRRMIKALMVQPCVTPEVLLFPEDAGTGANADYAVTKRIVGVDINQRYLDEVQRRFGSLAGLELHCRDLAEQDVRLTPVALVHAALIFEHTGLGLALENTLSLVAPEGSLSVVLQLPSEDEHGVASTCYTAMQRLKHDFALIDVPEFQGLLGQKGFRLV